MASRASKKSVVAAAPRAKRARALVLGATGALGRAIAGALERDGFAVARASRTRGAADAWVDPAAEGGLGALSRLPRLDAVVWAQGANVNDDVSTRSKDGYRRVMSANVDYVLETLQVLLEYRRLSSGAALCVVSSIWQEQARAGKLSYTISKAAVGGLVRAAALDLAPRGIRVNAVLPGVVDTPMTRATLSPAELGRVRESTPLGRLTTANEIADVVAMLVGARSSAMTGQSVVVDGGFSISRRL